MLSLEVLMVERLVVNIFLRKYAAEPLHIRMDRRRLLILEASQISRNEVRDGNVVLSGVLLGELEASLRQANCELCCVHGEPFPFRTARIAVLYGSGKESLPHAPPPLGTTRPSRPSEGV